MIGRRSNWLVGAVALSTLGSAASAQTTPPQAPRPCPNTGAVAQRISLKPDQLKWNNLSAGMDISSIVTLKNPHDALMSAALEGTPSTNGVWVDQEKFPAQMRTATHMHPFPERVYVLKGSVNTVVGVGGDDKAVNYPAGSYVVIPSYTRHYSFTTEPAEVLVFQVGPVSFIHVP